MSAIRRLVTHFLENLREGSSVELNELLVGVSHAKDYPYLDLLTCSLFRSFPNCWKPSSRVMKLADILEAVAVLACMTLFLSKRVLRRSLSYVGFSHCPSRGSNDRTNLSLLLKIECVDFLELSFLAGAVSLLWEISAGTDDLQV